MRRSVVFPVQPGGTEGRFLGPDSDVPGDDGRPMPFDRSRIFPYAFRSSFAQRHADAGTDIDVLMDLMDHRSPDVTMTYYNPRELHQTGTNALVTNDGEGMACICLVSSATRACRSASEISEAGFWENW